jgi:hypothetical protein
LIKDRHKEAEMDEKLVAPCGLYCGACEMFRADHDDNELKLRELAKGMSEKFRPVSVEEMRCDGCLGEGQINVWCQGCNIRLCSKHSAEQTLCSECPEFPCERLSAFNNDGMPHHSEIIANLRQLKKIGLTDWAKNEEMRWRCPQCQTQLSWYDQSCPQCGARRSNKLFQLPE